MKKVLFSVSLILVFFICFMTCCEASHIISPEINTSLFQISSTQNNLLDSSEPIDPPENWSSTEGPYSILGKWEYSGSGSCWIDGYGNVFMQIRNGKLELSGEGDPGSEIVTYAKESYTLTITADTVETQNFESEYVTNLLVSDNYAKKTDSTGLVEEIFLLSDNTMKIHKYGSTVIGTRNVEDFDIWYSALRDNSTNGGGGGGGGCNIQKYSLPILLLILPLLFLQKGASN